MAARARVCASCSCSSVAGGFVSWGSKSCIGWPAVRSAVAVSRGLAIAPLLPFAGLDDATEEVQDAGFVLHFRGFLVPDARGQAVEGDGRRAVGIGRDQRHLPPHGFN